MPVGDRIIGNGSFSSSSAMLLFFLKKGVILHFMEVAGDPGGRQKHHRHFAQWRKPTVT